MSRSLSVACLLLLIVTACGGDETTRPAEVLEAPGADRVQALLESPPHVSDEMRLTGALQLKQEIDAEYGEGAFRRALRVASLRLGSSATISADELLVRQHRAFVLAFGRDADPEHDRAFIAFVRNGGGLPNAHAVETTLSPQDMEAAGTLRKVAVIAAQQIEAWDEEAVALRADGEIEEAQKLEAQANELQSYLDRLAASAAGQVDTLRTGLSGLALAVSTAGRPQPGESVEMLAARTQLLDETLYDDKPIAERIEALNTHPHGAYHYVPKSGHGDLITSLERIEEHRKAFRERDEADGDDRDPGKREKRYLEAHQSLEAGAEIVNLLGATGAIDDATRDTLNTGLEYAHNLVGLAGSLATGDISGVIANGARVLTMLFGMEPPPDPAEVRHEQVMNALVELAKGQQQIMDMIVSLSEQSHAQHKQVMEKLGLLDDIHAIVSSTHRMVAEQQLEGLRDFRQFMEKRKYYAVAVTDPMTGEMVRHPELGFGDYEAARNHFEQNKELYEGAVRFLNNVTRGEELNLLRVVTNEKALEKLAEDLGMKIEDVRRPLTDAIAQRNAAWGFVLREIDPKYHKAILGAMATPSVTFDDLIAKFERVADPDPAAAAEYRARYESLGLEQARERYYNPLLVDEIVEGHIRLRPYDLLVSEEGTLKPEEDLLAARADLLAHLGEDRASRFANFTEPLRQADALLKRSATQNAMISGDVLIPIFATLGLSRSYGPRSVRAYVKDKGHRTSLAAYRVLLENPLLRENAVRFQYYAAFSLDRAQIERIQDLAVEMIVATRGEMTNRPARDTRWANSLTEERRQSAVEGYAYLLGEADFQKDYGNADTTMESVLSGFDIILNYRSPERTARPDAKGTIRDPRAEQAWSVAFYDPDDRKAQPIRLQVPLRHEIEAGKMMLTVYGDRLADRQEELDTQLLSYTLAFGMDEDAVGTHRRLLMQTLIWAAALD